MKRKSRSFEPRPQSSSSDDEPMEVSYAAVERSIVIEDTPEVQRKEYNSFKDKDYRGIIL